MAKQTVRAFVHWEKDSWSGDVSIKLYPFDMSDCSAADTRALIGEQDVVVDVPDDFDPTGTLIAAVEREKVALQKQFAEQLMRLDQRLSELRALPAPVPEEALF